MANGSVVVHDMDSLEKFGMELAARSAELESLYNALTAVSYTHLDVYKRQIRRGNSAFLLNGRNDADEAVGFQIKAPFYPQYSTPMWKTKRKTCKDVYKRQGKRSY